MESPSVKYLIDPENEIIFNADYVNLENLVCSLRGEFLEKDKPYDPPMLYELSQVRVTTWDVQDILKDVYRFKVITEYPEVAKRIFEKP